MTFGPHDRPKPAAECRGFYELASMKPGVEERCLDGVFGSSSLAQNCERARKRGVLKRLTSSPNASRAAADDPRSTAVATSAFEGHQGRPTCPRTKEPDQWHEVTRPSSD